MSIKTEALDSFYDGAIHHLGKEDEYIEYPDLSILKKKLLKKHYKAACLELVSLLWGGSISRRDMNECLADEMRPDLDKFVKKQSKSAKCKKINLKILSEDEVDKLYFDDDVISDREYESWQAWNRDHVSSFSIRDHIIRNLEPEIKEMYDNSTKEQQSEFMDQYMDQPHVKNQIESLS